MLSEKDLIAINNRFSNGQVVNPSSLKYTIDFIKKDPSWIKSLAHLTRAILLDHIFEDGNKRTTVAVIAACLDEKGYNLDIDNINSMIVRILRGNITKIEKIERLIENVIRTSTREV